MIVVSMTEARANLAKVVRHTKRKGARVVLTHRGRPVAYMLSAREIEDFEDSRDALAAQEEIAREGAIPWEQVKREAGLA